MKIIPLISISGVTVAHYFFCLLPLFLVHSLHADFRQFEGRNGNKIHAEIIDLKANRVELRLDTGRRFTLPYSEFSDADIEYLKGQYQSRSEVLLTADSRLEVVVMKGRSDKLARNGDYDDERLFLNPTVHITNKELDESYKNASVTLLLLGKSALKGGNTRKVLLRDDFKMDLPATKKTTHHSQKSYTGTYDDHAAARYGFEYDTYILILKNRKGDLVLTRLPGSIEVEDALKAKEGVVYDRKLSYSIKE